MLIDAKYFPCVQKAQNGNVRAQQELTRILSSVKTPANRLLAKHYLDAIIHNYSETDTKTDIVEVMRRRGIMEFCDQNFNGAMKWYLDAIKYMHDNYRPAEWNLGIYDDLKEVCSIIKQLNKEEID